MNIKEKIENWIKETLGADKVVLTHPKDIKNGDYSFFVAGDSKEYLEKLEKNKLKEIEKIEAIGKFINIYLSKDFFADSITEINKEKEDYGKTNLLLDQKIFIEHTQPNPFKEFHIGHLMNNAIGESVSRILKANKAEVKTCSYHGDVGLHVAKALWAKVQNPDLDWTKTYAYGSQNGDEHTEEIVAINKKIYDKSDKKINELYEEGRKKSLEKFKEIYKRLENHFDYNFFESESGKMGKEIVKENIGKVFEESEGAVIFRGENFEPKTHTRVFLTKEGLPTYEAKEVGLAQIKKDKFKYNQSITVTANEQDAFFSVVEVAIGEVFPELKGKLKHLSHGMLRLPSGKMSSRTGDVITAESLIDQIKAKILEKIADRNFDANEKDEIAEMVTIGAIKYSILRQAVGGDIIFDFDKSISFEGDSGPYLQYTYVRAKSVLNKAPSSKLQASNFALENWETAELEKYLYRFPEVVERASGEYAPHHLVTYLTELASIFNSFYAKEKIIDENDLEGSTYKLALTEATAHTIKNGLHLLGIKVPERM